MAEKPTGNASTPATKAVGGGDHDRVAMASRHPDGSPAQTPDFTYIGDPDVAVSSAKTQLAEQAVSAADVKARGVTADEDTDSEPDSAVAELAKTHKDAVKAAESAADSEVKARVESSK